MALKQSVALNSGFINLQGFKKIVYLNAILRWSGGRKACSVWTESLKAAFYWMDTVFGGSVHVIFIIECQVGKDLKVDQLTWISYILHVNF